MTESSSSPPEKKKRVFKQRDTSRPLDVLTESQQKTLLLLERYRYMTVRQLVECSVAKNAATIRRDVMPRLTRLSGHNLVQVDKHLPFAMVNGRFSYIYALTAHGAAVVADLLRTDVSDIRYPVGGIQFANDFQHREAYVDLCIALDVWLAEHEERACLKLTHYFDKIGANRQGGRMRSVNRLELPGETIRIVPDGLALIDTETKRRALALELHHKTDTKAVVEQLVKLMHALSAGVIERHLGHDKSPFVLSVTTMPQNSALVRKRLATVRGIEKFSPVFLFNDLQTIMREGFATGWVHYNGQPATVF